MAQPINSYLPNDVYKPFADKPSLQQYDNYQIYTLVCRDILFSTEYGQYVSPYDSSVNFGSYFPTTLQALQATGYYYSPHPSAWQIDEFGNYVQLSTPLHVQEPITTSRFNDWLAIQSFSPSPIKIDFLAYVTNYSDIDTLPLVTHTYGTTNIIASDVHKYNLDGSVTTEWLELTGNNSNFPDLLPGNYSRKITGYETFNTGIVGEPTGYRWLVSFFEKIITSPLPPFNKPSYMDLLDGYAHDSRSIPNQLKVIPDYSGELSIGYYRESSEPIPGLRTIDWFDYGIDVIEKKPIYLPITNCALGTLWVSNLEIENQIKLKPTLLGQYSYRSLFPEGVSNLFAEWEVIYQDSRNQPVLAGTILQTNIYHQISKTINILGANNNVWNNGQAIQDVGFNINHPMFTVDSQRAYDWHIKPVAEGIGELIVDSPRTIEIHKALDAAKYAIDPNTGNARVANLGWHINRQSELLGCRVNPDGTIDEALEKTTNRRLHVDGTEANDPQKNNPNCFGSESMLVRYVPNKFSPNGTVAGGYRKVKDIPQLLAELHEQANAAMGYQEGTAIEIQLDGETYRYPNQLALLTELFVTAKQTATYSKGAFFSSVIGEQSIKEVMAGLGLRTVDKFMEFEVAGKAVKLYYKGISASQSIRRKLSAVSTNIGIAIGNII